MGTRKRISKPKPEEYYRHPETVYTEAEIKKLGEPRNSQKAREVERKLDEVEKQNFRWRKKRKLQKALAHVDFTARLPEQSPTYTKRLGHCSMVYADPKF